MKNNLTLEEETDLLLKITGFDTNIPIYGALSSIESDETLVAMRETLIDYIEKDKTQNFINKFHLLLEVERELTLREDL